jgi:hypothetical protein
MSRSVKQRKRGPTRNVNAEAAAGKPRPGDGVNKYDGRSDQGSRGTKGKEPGGRFSPAYYETKGTNIGQNVTQVNK